MQSKKRVLILCTGNSCRSQMAEAFLKQLRPEWEVYSAGTDPAPEVHPKAVQVMKEIGLDLSMAKPKGVEQFLDESFDYVITVCDNARETCPVFTGQVNKQIHIGFEDPAAATGTEDEVLRVFRRVRDQIRESFATFVRQVDQESEPSA